MVYCNGHNEQLLRQPFFFARKISAHAKELRQDLDRAIRGELKTGKLSRSPDRQPDQGL